LIVVVAVTTSVLTSVLLSRYYLRGIERLLDLRAGLAASASLTRAGAAGEFWSAEELSQLERDIDVTTIWVIGQDFSGDLTEGAPFLSVIRYNVYQRGVSYVYIAPDLALPRHQIGALRAALNLSVDDVRLRGIMVSHADWARLPYTDGNVTFYDPSTPRRTTAGYFWYPGGDGASFGRLGTDVVTKWVAQIEEICPSVSTGPTA
jgi:hypothetical protein